ncbi:hypothetical protein QZH41_001970 [Actinostola sp. cb2023]|nr:hypothetical protein QZH41_001970 [Actinostola sp. cb2023]
MAMANLRTSIEEQVTCAICHEHFTDPRLLPCLHTYCKHCVDAIVRAPSRTHGEITCPECREIVKINPGATNQFKVNFQMNNLLSLLAINSPEGPEDAAAKTKLACENCSTDEAVKGRCIDCCKFMCEFCLKAHKRFLETQDHKMMTLEEVKQHGAQALTPKVKCEKHKGEAKKLFCESCQELICRDCTIVDHREHQFQFIEVAAKNHKASLKGDVEEALKAEKKVEEALTSVKTMKQRIHVQTENIQKEIDDIIDNKIAGLEEKRRNLRKEAKSLAETKTANLYKQEDDLKMKIASLKSSIEFSKELLRNDNNVNIVSVSSEARSRLSTLSRAPFNNQPCQQDTLKLQVNDAAYNQSLNNLMKVFETGKMRSAVLQHPARSRGAMRVFDAPGVFNIYHKQQDYYNMYGNQ